MIETLDIVLAIAGFVGLPGALVAYIVLSQRKLKAKMETRRVQLTPSQTLAEAMIPVDGTVDLRARATRGAHKVWLEFNAAEYPGLRSTKKWSATARVVHRISPPGVAYRDAAPEAAATAEWPIAFGDDGDGLSTLGSVSVLRTGALGIPRGDSYWLQLMTLPPCPEGSDLFVCVGVGDIKNAPGATFRAFIGVSEA